MGLFDRLRGRATKDNVPRPDDRGIEPATELAGYFVAHAVWCVGDGETLVPLLGHESAAGRQMIRLAAERLEDGVAQGKAWIEANPSDVARAVLVFDGFWTPQNERKDALIATAVSYGMTRQSIEIVLPYRNAKAERGFAVHRPKFRSLTGGNVNLALLGEAFFRGVDAHAKGAKVWADHLDESS